MATLLQRRLEVAAFRVGIICEELEQDFGCVEDRNVQKALAKLRWSQYWLTEAALAVQDSE